MLACDIGGMEAYLVRGSITRGGGTMLEMAQGDIFKAGLEEHRDLIIVFGHIGFNQIKYYWDQFRTNLREFKSISDPFVTCPDQPINYTHNGNTHYIIFVNASKNDGMSDETVRAALDTALEFAHTNSLETVITNGIANTDRGTNTASHIESDNKRVHFLITTCVPNHVEKFKSIKLISLDDTYIRPN